MWRRMLLVTALATAVLTSGVDYITTIEWLRVTLKLICAIPLYYYLGDYVGRELRLAAKENEAKRMRHNARFWQTEFDRLTRNWNEFTANFLAQYIEDSFAGTYVTRHVVRYKNGQLECRIGDDDDMVDVDMQMVKKADFRQALLQAYKRFVAKKAEAP